MLCAILCTSESGNGGEHRVVFSCTSAAMIDASLMPLRRMTPAMLARAVLRAPSPILPVVASPVGMAGLDEAFGADIHLSSHSGADTGDVISSICKGYH